MAKNTKNNLYDIEKENNKKKKNNKNNNRNNKKLKKTKKIKDEKTNNEKVSFDNEIIIGVTNVSIEQNTNNKKQKKKIKNKEKNKKQSVKQSSNQKNKINNNKKEKKNIKEENEYVEKIILDEEDFLEQRKVEKKEKRIRKFRIIKTMMIIGLIITTFLLIIFSPLFNIKEINVEGNELISTEQILSLAGIEKESNIFKLNIGRVSEKIKEDLYIEEAEVNRELPSKISIKIKERKPSFIVEYANGYAVIDRKGMVLELITEKKELPVLQGLETPNDKFEVGKKLDNNDINKVYIVSRIIDVANDCEMGNLISRIDIENKKEVKLIIESKDKTAYIGDDSNLNIKLLTIKQMMDKTEGQAGEIFVNMDLNSEYPVFRERV